MSKCMCAGTLQNRAENIKICPICGNVYTRIKGVWKLELKRNDHEARKFFNQFARRKA